MAVTSLSHIPKNLMIKWEQHWLLFYNWLESSEPEVLSEPGLFTKVLPLPKCVSGPVSGLAHVLAKLITKHSISGPSAVIFCRLSLQTVKLHHPRLIHSWGIMGRLQSQWCRTFTSKTHRLLLLPQYFLWTSTHPRYMALAQWLSGQPLTMLQGLFWK